MHKGEWNGVLSDNSFAEIRAGQYGYDWTNGVNGTGLRYEDIGNNQITGRNRNWARERRRDQVLGSVSYFKNGWGGDHNFKIGGEIFHETTTDIYIDGYEEEIVHVLNNGVKSEVILFQPGDVDRRLVDLRRVRPRHVARQQQADVQHRRALRSLPRVLAGTGPPGQPLQSHRAAFRRRRQIRLVEPNPAPRLGMTYDLLGNGKTVLKANYGTYWHNPGADFVFNISPNASGVVAAVSLDRYQQQQPLGAGRRRRRADLVSRRRSPTESLDPNLENEYTKEFATFIERELMPNFGVRAGYVWRGVRNQYGRVNLSIPYSAFTVPVSVRDPGPDGRARHRR